MHAYAMLQLVVDDADTYAKHAHQNGLEPQGSNDMHGEHICFPQALGGLPKQAPGA